MNIDNMETFYKSNSGGNFYIYFIGISKNYHYYTFKTEYSRNYNYQRIMDSWGMTGVLYLNDEEQSEIIEEYLELTTPRIEQPIFFKN